MTAVELSRPDVPLEDAGLPADPVIDRQQTLYDALNEMLTSFHGASPVVDSEGAYCGVVDIEVIAAAIKAMRAEARERYRGEDGGGDS